MTESKILVTGGAGFFGGVFVPHLIATGGGTNQYRFVYTQDLRAPAAAWSPVHNA